jgi:hypothetical protein
MNEMSDLLANPHPTPLFYMNNTFNTASFLNTSYFKNSGEMHHAS